MGALNLTDPRAAGLLRRVQAYCEQNGLFRGCRAVFAGVSGGADSVSLLFLLREILGQMPAARRPALYAVHVHHHIRGKEADADAQFVRELAERLGVPFILKQVNAPDFAASHKCSLEEAARILRYQALREAAEETLGTWTGAGDREDTAGRAGVYSKTGAGDRAGGRIAVAHTKNDQAETVLFRLARGSGIKGLSGMKPKSGLLIRPLLCLSRQDTEDLLHIFGESYVTDSTNLGRENARGILRRDVIPGLLELNAQAVAHIASAAQELGEAEELLEEQTEALKKEALRGKDMMGGYRLFIPVLVKAPALLARRVILSCLSDLSAAERDWSAVHAQAVYDLLKEQTGSQVDLPYACQAVREYDWLVLTRNEKGKASNISAVGGIAGELSPPGRSKVFESGSSKAVCLSEADCQRLETGGLVRERLQNWQVTFSFAAQFAREADSRYTKFFDYDKIKGILWLRNPHPGDICQTGSQTRASLKKVLKDRKVPASRRPATVLLAAGNEVYWIIGVRRSESAKITDLTKRILRVDVVWKEEEHG